MSAQASAIRRAIHEVDPSQAVAAAKPIEQYVSESLARPKLYAVLVACFAVIAVMLAAIGAVRSGGLCCEPANARNRYPTGARGHRPGRVRRAVTRQGAWLVSGGVVFGVAAAPS